MYPYAWGFVTYTLSVTHHAAGQTLTSRPTCVQCLVARGFGICDVVVKLQLYGFPDGVDG